MVISQKCQKNCELDHCWNTVIRMMHGEQCLEELKGSRKKGKGPFFFSTGAYLFPELFFGMIYFVPPVSNIYIQFLGHVDSY